MAVVVATAGGVGGARSGRAARSSIDAKFAAVPDIAAVLAKPRAGWVRTIREALGMTLSDLASRVSVDTSTLSRIEANEAAGKSNLETLQKLAEALNCELVYALVPKSGLQASVDRQAREVAGAYVFRTQQTMAFEEQSLRAEELESLTDQLASELIDSKGLWRNPDFNAS